MADLAALAGRIEGLSPPDQLRLAAELLEARRPELAYAVAQKTVDHLGAVVRLGARLLCPAAGGGRTICVADWTACAAAGKCTRGAGT